MPTLTINFFGSPSIYVNGENAPKPRSKKTLALLALLALSNNQKFSRGRLAQIFWPDSTTEAALASLRMTVSNLKKVLSGAGTHESPLEITRSTISFNADRSDCLIDVLELNKGHQQSLALLNQAVELANATEALPTLERALNQYVDQFMAGYRFPDARELDNWLVSKQIELEHTANETLVNVGYLHLALHNIPRAIAIGRQTVARSKNFEPAHQLLIKALASSGKYVEAIAHFEEFSGQLQETLELSPSAATVGLVEQIRSGNFVAAINSPREKQGPDLPENINLAAIVRSRSKQLRQLLEALNSPTKVVVLNGNGGSGRTALIEYVLKNRQEKQAVNPDEIIINLRNVSSKTDLMPRLASAIPTASPYSGRDVMAISNVIGRRKCLVLINAHNNVLTATQIKTVDTLAVLVPNIKFVIAAGKSTTFEIPTKSIDLRLQTQSCSVKSQVPLPSVDLFRQVFQKHNPDQTNKGPTPLEITYVAKLLDHNPQSIALIAARQSTKALAVIATELNNFLQVHPGKPLSATLHWIWEDLSQVEQFTLAHLIQFRNSASIQTLNALGIERADLLALVKSGLAQLISPERIALPTPIWNALRDLLELRPEFKQFQAQLSKQVSNYFLNSLVALSVRNIPLHHDASSTSRPKWEHYIDAFGVAVTNKDWSVVLQAFDAVTKLCKQHQLYDQAIEVMLDICTELEADSGQLTSHWDTVTKNQLQAKVLLALAELNFLSRNYDQACSASAEAVSAAKHINSRNLKTASALQHACCQLAVRNYDCFEDNIDTIQETALETNDQALIVKGQYLTAAFAYAQGCLSIAVRVLEDALTTCDVEALEHQKVSVNSMLSEIRALETLPDVMPHVFPQTLLEAVA